MEIQSDIHILHFNDAYNIQETTQEPVGGISRFYTAWKSYQKSDTFSFFSGDLLSPSDLSNLYNGQQMVEPVSMLNLDCACYGNHEFDLEIDDLIPLIQKTGFPWFISNLFDKETNTPILDSKEYFIFEKNKRKVGVVALVEVDWVKDLITIDIEDIKYIDFIEKGRELAKLLKEQHKCDMLIGLTHMRVPNMVKLAEAVGEYDMLLGGHDHFYHFEQVNETICLISGTDFRDFTSINVFFNKFDNNIQIQPKRQIVEFPNKQIQIIIDHVEVTKQYPQDEYLEKYVNQYYEQFNQQMKKEIGYSTCEIEGRFKYVRSQETNLGNFFADITRLTVDAECAIVNSGSLRIDTLIPKGIFNIGTLVKIFPFLDFIVMLEMSGELILEALENSVSRYPAYEGRFPCVSNLRFSFDPSQEPGQRIIRDSVYIGEEQLQLDRLYKVATKHFLQQGKDGYDVFMNCKVLVDEHATLEVQKIFISLFKLSFDELEYCQIEHTNSLHPVHLETQKSIPSRKIQEMNKRLRNLFAGTYNENGKKLHIINPILENRISIIKT